MMADLPCLLDTNILLRFFPVARTNYPQVVQAVHSLVARDVPILYTSQNLSEFWNVCTRPAKANGLGLSIYDTDALVQRIERGCTLAPDSEATHQAWRRLIVTHQVAGAQVHDARIVATMQVNGISNLLTLNIKDFRRYPEINAMAPADLLAS